MQNQENIEKCAQLLYSAYESFCRGHDSVECKTYFLALLFVKYYSDKGVGSYVLPEHAKFAYLYAQRDAVDLGLKINDALREFEGDDRSKLMDLFMDVDFTSEATLGAYSERNQRLRTLLEDFGGETFDVNLSQIQSSGDIGDVVDCFLQHLALQEGNKSLESRTPKNVSEILIRLLSPKEGDSICDPFCGSGALLIAAAKQLGSASFLLYAQDVCSSACGLCKINMRLHGIDIADIKRADAITQPLIVYEDGCIRKFDMVVAHLPFKMKGLDKGIAASDKYERFTRGIPSKGDATWALICHMIAITKQGGRLGVIVPQSALSRDGADGRIRKQIIAENILAGVIALPSNMLHGFDSDVPSALMIFDKTRNKGGKERVMMIDASRRYKHHEDQEPMSPQDIDELVETFLEKRSIGQYSRSVSFQELEEKDFSLKISYYIDTSDRKPELDLKQVRSDIGRLGIEIFKVETEINKCLDYLEQSSVGKDDKPWRIFYRSDSPDHLENG